ncbi:MAG: lipid-A-disaccharide synthase [Candidatus Magnetoovum sp. WYHC-5]|nr:lipid-A-disaccharide synthase [Candidatus Magnetoovum sp. WYHC-5]
MPKRRIMIIAGESSGELYAAMLAKKLRLRLPDVELIGIGGKKMEAEGIELIDTITGAFGLVEAFSSLKKLLSTYKKVVNILTILKVDLLVLIDFPEFNLMVAKKANRLGIKILYYVSPQVWAWRQGRIKKIAHLSVKIAAILPFEPKLYEPYGGNCEFVGHPIAEEIRALKVDKETFFTKNLLCPDKPVIAILPGSRHSELQRLLPVLIEAITLLKNKYQYLQFILSVAPNIEEHHFKEHFNTLKTLGVIISKENASIILSTSHTAIIASGTAAFQGALIGIPMVVIYKLSWLTYILAKQLIKVKYVNLTNLIFDKPIIPELIQEHASAKNIVQAFDLIYNN